MGDCLHTGDFNPINRIMGVRFLMSEKRVTNMERNKISMIPMVLE